MPYIKGALSSPEFQKKLFHYLHSVWRVLPPPKKIKIKGPEISPKEMVQYFPVDNKS